MKGEIISTQFNFEVKYEEDGVRKYLQLLPDSDTSNLKIGMEVEFEIVTKLNEGVTYTTEDGWNRNPIEGYYAKIKDGWSEIEEEYMKDEYPVFGGPFNNALTPWEWLKKYYIPPHRKDDKKLYSDIENVIIKWVIDNDKTAGTLTRELLDILNKK